MQLVGATLPFPGNGAVEKLHGDITNGPHLIAWTKSRWWNK